MVREPERFVLQWASGMRAATRVSPSGAGRYRICNFHLLALINGWPAPERLATLIDWSVTALRVRAAR
ncbi:hypothetical protein [Streptomyces sp. NPDC054804]